MFSSKSSESRIGISHTHGHRGPLSGPKTTRDTHKVAAFCFVRLMMLAYDPPIRISSCATVFCSHPPHISLGWAYCTPMAIGASTAAPKQSEIPLRLVRFALSFDASMQTSQKDIRMLSNFLLFPTSCQSRMGILYTHGHRDPPRWPQNDQRYL